MVLKVSFCKFDWLFLTSFPKTTFFSSESVNSPTVVEPVQSTSSSVTLEWHYNEDDPAHPAFITGYQVTVQEIGSDTLPGHHGPSECNVLDQSWVKKQKILYFNIFCHEKQTLVWVTDILTNKAFNILLTFRSVQQVGGRPAQEVCDHRGSAAEPRLCFLCERSH